MAGRLGATDLVDPADGDPVEQVRALTGGRGADYVLEAAGMTAAQEQALTTARRAGTIVLTGVERLGATITYPQFELALQGRARAQLPERQRPHAPRPAALRRDARGRPARRRADHHLALRARRHQRGARGVGREARPHAASSSRTDGLDAHLPAARARPHLTVEREPVDGRLPGVRRRRRSPPTACSARAAGGTCASARQCLTSVSRERAPRLGSLRPLGLRTRSR